MAIKGIFNHENDIINVIRNQPSINFIAFAITPWHALSIDALILKLNTQGINIKAAIVIVEHYLSGYVINEHHFTNNCTIYYKLPNNRKDDKTQPQITNNGSKSTIRYKIYDIINFYKYILSDINVNKKKDILYYTTCYVHSVHLARAIYNMGKHVILCSSEEGVATYMGTLPPAYLTFSNVHNFTELRSYIRCTLFGVKLLRLLHKTETSRLFRKTFGHLIINNKIIPYYRKVFKLQIKRKTIPIKSETITNSIIICTTAWERTEIIDEEDFNVLKRVCKEINERKYNIFIKPHPRDKYWIAKAQDLNAKVLDIPNISMECLCEYAQPKAIISFSSTTLVNAKLFWNIPVFCISDMLNRSHISPKYLKEIDTFKRTFGHLINYV